MPKENLKDGADVREATHVKTPSGNIEKIKSTWGISSDGKLSKDGFGVITESGNRVDMWDSKGYFREEQH